jgi:hypothetical protein
MILISLIFHLLVISSVARNLMSSSARIIRFLAALEMTGWQKPK